MLSLTRFIGSCHNYSGLGYHIVYRAREAGPGRSGAGCAEKVEKKREEARQNNEVLPEENGF
jgi:hypothetical protein